MDAIMGEKSLQGLSCLVHEGVDVLIFGDGLEVRADRPVSNGPL